MSLTGCFPACQHHVQRFWLEHMEMLKVNLPENETKDTKSSRKQGRNSEHQVPVKPSRGKSRRRNLQKDIKILLPQAGIEPRYVVVGSCRLPAGLPASVEGVDQCTSTSGKDHLEKFSNAEQESNLDLKDDTQWSRTLRLSCLNHELNPALLHQRRETQHSEFSCQQQAKSHV